MSFAAASDYVGVAHELALAVGGGFHPVGNFNVSSVSSIEIG